MLSYIMVGAAVGVLVGYLIPPGSFFWFVVGGVAGYLFKHFNNRGL